MPDEISAAPAPLRSVQPSIVFQALGNGTRQTMIRHLATGATLCVKDFVPLTQMTQDGVCRHIGVLLRTGIVLAGFSYFANQHLDRLVTCLLGFIAARIVVTRMTRPAPEASHAS